jgi:hypothetical protein
VKQPDDAPHRGIDPRNVGPFVAVAEIARKREILGGRLARMLLGDDVIDLERRASKL